MKTAELYGSRMGIFALTDTQQIKQALEDGMEYEGFAYLGRKYAWISYVVDVGGGRIETYLYKAPLNGMEIGQYENIDRFPSYVRKAA